jgi:hypothetical protein
MPWAEPLHALLMPPNGRLSVIIMSRGAGQIEARISDLFAGTRHRALSIDDITDHAFALCGRTPTRAQRLSATRAAHRLLRRVREIEARADKLRLQAREQAEKALGRPERMEEYDVEFKQRLRSTSAWRAAERLRGTSSRIGVWDRIVAVEGKRGWRRTETDHWCTTTLKGRLFFHPPDVPVRVWAVSLGRGGITWAETEIAKVTARNVMARYGGTTARLDRRRLWYWWAFWRGVRFVSSRTGRIAAELERLWWERYGTTGSVPPSMQMPLAEAMELLGVPADYTKQDVLTAFRRKAKEAHPDLGGTAEMFRKLVEARDRLLAALGTSAPPPKPPRYTATGARIVYRSRRRSQSRLGFGRALLP